MSKKSCEAVLALATCVSFAAVAIAHVSTQWIRSRNASHRNSARVRTASLLPSLFASCCWLVVRAVVGVIVAGTQARPSVAKCQLPTRMIDLPLVRIVRFYWIGWRNLSWCVRWLYVPLTWICVLPFVALAAASSVPLLIAMPLGWLYWRMRRRKVGVYSIITLCVHTAGVCELMADIMLLAVATIDCFPVTTECNASIMAVRVLLTVFPSLLAWVVWGSLAVPIQRGVAVSSEGRLDPEKEFPAPHGSQPLAFVLFVVLVKFSLVVGRVAMIYSTAIALIHRRRAFEDYIGKAIDKALFVDFIVSAAPLALLTAVQFAMDDSGPQRQWQLAKLIGFGVDIVATSAFGGRALFGLFADEQSSENTPLVQRA